MKHLRRILLFLIALTCATITSIAQENGKYATWNFSPAWETACEEATGYHFEEVIPPKAASLYGKVTHASLYYDKKSWLIRPVIGNNGTTNVLADYTIPVERLEDAIKLMRAMKPSWIRPDWSITIFETAGQKEDDAKTEPEGMNAWDGSWEFYSQRLTLGKLYTKQYLTISPSNVLATRLSPQQGKASSVVSGVKGIDTLLRHKSKEGFFHSMLKDERDAYVQRVAQTKKLMTAYAKEPSEASCNALKAAWNKGTMTLDDLKRIEQGWYLLVLNQGLLIVKVSHFAPAKTLTLANEEPVLRGDSKKVETTGKQEEQPLTSSKEDTYKEEYEKLLGLVMERLQEQPCNPCPEAAKQDANAAYKYHVFHIGIGGQFEESNGKNAWAPYVEANFGMFLNKKRPFFTGIGIGVSYAPKLNYNWAFPTPAIGPFEGEITYERLDGMMVGARLNGYIGYRNAFLINVSAGPDFYFGFDETVTEEIRNTMNGDVTTRTYGKPDFDLQARRMGKSYKLGAYFFVRPGLLLGFQVGATQMPDGWYYIKSSSETPALRGEALGVDNRVVVNNVSLGIGVAF